MHSFHPNNFKISRSAHRFSNPTNFLQWNFLSFQLLKHFFHKKIRVWWNWWLGWAEQDIWDEIFLCVFYKDLLHLNKSIKMLFRIKRKYYWFQAENALSTYVPDALVIVYSVVDSNSFQKAEEILQYLWRTGSSTNKAVILVGNKSDLVRTRVVSIVGKKQSLLTMYVLLTLYYKHGTYKRSAQNTCARTVLINVKPIFFHYVSFSCTGIFFQKHLFLHQLTHNMTKDCSNFNELRAQCMKTTIQWTICRHIVG